MAETYSAGVVTAYGAAVRGGYTGTYEEFCAEQAEFAENAAAVAQAKEDVEIMQGQVEQAAATFTGTTVPAAVTTVQETGAAQVQAVQSEGTMQAAAVETVGAQQTAAVGAAGSDAVDAVEAAETAATDAVTAAQTAAVQAVQTESTTQQAAIQTKGEQTIASIPEDYTALSGEVDDLKSALEILQQGTTVDTLISWDEAGAAGSPTGWSTGYYNKDTGERVSSNVYIKTNAAHMFEKSDATMLEVVAPDGYYVAAYEYDATGAFVKRWGDPNPANEGATTQLFFAFSRGHKFKFSLGRFAGATDASNHINDTAFLTSCRATFYSVANDTTKAMPDLTLPFVYDAQTESGIKFPALYTATGKATPLVILAHGLSSQLTSTSWGNTDMTNLVSRFAESGFAVIDVNRVTSQDWCNPALVAKYVAAVDAAVDKYNLIPQFIFGESMGCLIGLRLSTLWSTIKASVISGLRLDFAARYATATSDEKSIIDANLGFSNGYDADIAAGWDVTAISAVSDSDSKICPVQFPPTFFIGGADDTLTKAESLEKVAEIKRGGTIIRTAEYAGDHNAVCYLKAGTSYTDAVLWMTQWG